MKWLTCVVLLCVLGCKSDPIQQNPYLNNLPPFEFELSLDLPLYDGLRFAGGSITIEQLGVKGTPLQPRWFSNLGMGSKLSQPNTSDCSKTTINDIIVECSCDDSTYSLVTGQPLTDGVEYGLFNYGIRRSGNLVLIYN